MSRQTIAVNVWQNQFLRVLQRIVCSVNLGVAMCMLMILSFPANLYTEYDIPVIALLRMTFWIMSLCCPVSLNCADVVSAFLHVHCGNGVYSALRTLAVLGTMYLSLILSLAVVAALLGEPISLRLNLIFCAVLLFYVLILYRFVERSGYARRQRITFSRWWYTYGQKQWSRDF